MEKPIIAFMYDFDKTLSTTDMQNYSFIPNLGMTPDEFWNATGEFSKENEVERVLSYMYMMIKKCKDAGIPITREYLRECGKNIKFYPGVDGWFERVNEYAESKGLKLEHYLVSSGTKEIVEGCKIANYFDKIYGCEFLYDENGEACWPKLAINFTQKTQFFFRIAKGATETIDDAGVNAKSSEHRIPYRNIVYFGDGMTDIACMTLVKKNNGTSIAVYSGDENENVKQIFSDNRVNYYAKADYSKGRKLDTLCKLIIDKIAVLTQLDKKEKELAEQQ